MKISLPSKEQIASKKVVFPAIAIAVTAVAIIGMTANQPDAKPTAIKGSIATTTTASPAQNTTTLTASPELTTQTQSVSTSPTTTTPTPTPPYGEDPNTPGTYKVFDKTSVMNDAGIASSDQQYISGTVDRCSLFKDGQWVYNMGGEASHRTLVNIDNDTIAAAKQTYPDFSTNPVSQIKWLSARLMQKYGSLQAGYNACYTTGHF